MTDKPFKGTISSWKKVEFDRVAWAHQYPEDPPVLGYIIVGCPSSHPSFTHWIRTSPVIKHEGNKIETLNSVYELVGDEVP